MSSTRNRSRFCLSLDNSSSNTPSSGTIHLNRWSEVVPPKAALTFAALWDPDEGMVTFSGAGLLESESLSSIPPHSGVFDDDGQSQFVSADQELDSGTTTSESTPTLAAFQDAFKAFLHRTPSTTWDSKGRTPMKGGQGTSCCLQSRASSTFDGLDVYSHDIQVKSKRCLQPSCIDLLDIESSFRTPPAFGKLRLRSDLMLNSYHPESEESELYSRTGPTHLRSRFSTTTTSTSNYVDVAANALQSTRSSETPPIPEWWKGESASPSSSCPSLRQRRLLRKRRPLDSYASPSATNSTPSTPKKTNPRVSMSPLPSPSSSATPPSPRAALVRGEQLRGRFPRPIGAPIKPTPTPTPSTTPSKSPRLKLRFALLPRRKSRQKSPDSDGWVCIDVTPIIRQRFIADLDED